jgi:hypothetical protein
MTTEPGLKVGERVAIVIPEASILYNTAWWPKTGPVTGTVQKVFKNGKVAVAVDQLHNWGGDGLRTMHFQADDIVWEG